MKLAMLVGAVTNCTLVGALAMGLKVDVEFGLKTGTAMTSRTAPCPRLQAFVGNRTKSGLECHAKIWRSRTIAATKSPTCTAYPKLSITWPCV